MTGMAGRRAEAAATELKLADLKQFRFLAHVDHAEES